VALNLQSSCLSLFFSFSFFLFCMPQPLWVSGITDLYHYARQRNTSLT
jgi:hypothetical protein